MYILASVRRIQRNERRAHSSRIKEAKTALKRFFRWLLGRTIRGSAQKKNGASLDTQVNIEV
jgi:hypothetical protein